MKFKVMTLNLRFGLADDGDNSWDNRKKVYPEFLSTVSPDLLCVQEANNFQAEFLDDLLVNHHHIGMRTPSPHYWQNNIIYYDKTWCCLRKRHYFISNTPDRESKLEGSKWPRQFTIGVLEKGDKRIVIANTHFDFSEAVQKQSAELITGFLNDFQNDIPVIICGDFNASPESSAFTVFRKTGFHEVFEDNYSSTFHGFTGSDLGGHIDWILYKGPIQACSERVIKTQFSGIYPSDHFPVSVEFIY